MKVIVKTPHHLIVKFNFVKTHGLGLSVVLENSKLFIHIHNYNWMTYLILERERITLLSLLEFVLSIGFLTNFEYHLRFYL